MMVATGPTLPVHGCHLFRNFVCWYFFQGMQKLPKLGAPELSVLILIIPESEYIIRYYYNDR